MRNEPQRMHAVNGCFACVNSGEGFISYFDSLLRSCSYLYVIKGGPGTGKSGVMSYLAAEGERRKETVERIFCSSDPHSLDGVIFVERRIAVVDGTAPHTAEIKNPGVSGEYVDLGRFWSREALEEQKDEILDLDRKKSDAYKTAFSFLAAAKKTGECSLLALERSQNEKDRERAFKKLEAFFGGRTRPEAPSFRPMSSIGMDGRVALDCQIEEAEHICTLTPFFGGERLLLQRLSDACGRSSDSISPDPVSLLPDSIFSSERRTLLRCGAPLKTEKEKIVRTARFFSPSKEERTLLRSYEKTRQTLITAAEDALKRAKSAHFALEEIYKRAMDFTKVDLVKEELSRKLFI